MPRPNMDAIESTTAVTRREIADVLLRETDLVELRLQVKRNRRWAQMFHGFRPDFVPRSQFLISTAAVAADMLMLRSLCELYLESAGIKEGSDLRTRFRQLADQVGISDELKRIAEALGKCDLQDLALAPQVTADSVREPRLKAIANGIHQASPEPATEDVIRPSVETPVSAGSSDLHSDPLETEKPDYVMRQVMLDWQAPEDHVTEVQQAVTLFERALVEFVQRQLSGMHGTRWLERGCQMHKQWKAKAGRALPPATVLGYAELGDLRDVIVSNTNWPAFSGYFTDKEWLRRQFDDILPLRVSAAHAGQRVLRLLDQTAGLAAMEKVVRQFHERTANEIQDLFETALNATRADVEEDLDPHTQTAGLVMLTNLGDFQPPELVGRQVELERLQAFWDDEFKRVVSIVGQGGVGKTALLDAFVQRLREQPCPPSSRPCPEAIVYLTAKDNYLPYMQPAPEANRFKTVARIYEATLETLGDAASGRDMAELRKAVLRHAREVPILFALDNLESIEDPDWEDVREFLDQLPLPSKAIVTTREERRQGDKIDLAGLPPDVALTFLKDRLSFLGAPSEWGAEASWGLEQLVGESCGVPLVLIHCANAIAHGSSIDETLEQLRGQQFLDLLEFSFESTLTRLSSAAVVLLLYLALSREPRPKKAILDVMGDEQRYSAAVTALRAATFISQDWEKKQQVRFFIENLQLKEFVKKRAKEILGPETYDYVRRKAGVTLLDAGSSNVAAEVDRTLAHARELSNRSWADAIGVLESARKEWGDDPRLIAQLGYYYYRTRQLPYARKLLEYAIHEGQETADSHQTLALVLFYQKEYSAAIEHARDAMSLGCPVAKAEQVIGQCMLGIANSQWLTLDMSERQRLLREARTHLERSMITPAIYAHHHDHNARAESKIAEVDERLEILRQQAAARSRPQ